jgi:hypothetical protein
MEKLSTEALALRRELATEFRQAAEEAAVRLARVEDIERLRECTMAKKLGLTLEQAIKGKRKSL